MTAIVQPNPTADYGALARAVDEELAARQLLAVRARATDLHLTTKCLVRDERGRVLVLRDRSGVYLDFPGGHVHAGESATEAVLREVTEETGLAIGDLHERGSFAVELGGVPTVVQFFQATALTTEVRLSDEHTAYRWMLAPEIATAGDLGVFRQPALDSMGVQKREEVVRAAAQPDLSKHTAVRDAAQDRYQMAVNDWLAHAKQAKKKDRDMLAALFLLLMADAGEEAYAESYPTLAELAPEPHGKVRHEDGIQAEAKHFAKRRAKYLAQFPTATLDRFELAVKDVKSEKQIRQTLNAEAEAVRQTAGKLVAATEAQATYGDVQRRVLQRAGYKTKVWMTCDDDRVRPSHVDCGNQGAIAMDKPFVNGLQFPGDPAGGPEEVCNCRCWLIGGSR